MHSRTACNRNYLTATTLLPYISSKLANTVIVLALLSCLGQALDGYVTTVYGFAAAPPLLPPRDERTVLPLLLPLFAEGEEDPFCLLVSCGALPDAAGAAAAAVGVLLPSPVANRWGSSAVGFRVVA